MGRGNRPGVQVGRARKAKEDAQTQEEQKARKASASKLWTEVKGAFKSKARCLTLPSERKFSSGNPLTLIFALPERRYEGCVKGSYQDAGIPN